MYYLKIKTKYNMIELILDEGDFYDENLQHLLQQPYVAEVYLRWLDKEEYENNSQYYKIRRLEKNDKTRK